VRIEPGRHRIAENQLRAKHVVAAGWLTWDAGSIPAASTILPWKHNGLRHSYISYRLAIVKDVGQVSLEAGNSPGMVFKHYRQLVRESEANEWFGLMPPKQPDPGADIHRDSL
jgi:hypothetical protein